MARPIAAVSAGVMPSTDSQPPFLGHLTLAGAVLLAPTVASSVPEQRQHSGRHGWASTQQCSSPPPQSSGYVSAPRATYHARALSRARRLPNRPGIVHRRLADPQKAALYHVIASSRNLYGVLSVVSVDAENYIALRHGSTVHGFQYRDLPRARLSTGYYGPSSGANIIIRNWPAHPLRVGLVGMGVGTLAALAQPGDVFRFYEINPDVYKLSAGAHPYFTYLRDSPARVEVVLGDARLSLQRESSHGDFQNFDILILDAFSSDAIPMHLLTHEAFQVYAQHLRAPASVIAVHISNQTLDLRPVLAGISRDFSLHAVRVDPLLPTGPFSQSDWILLSRDSASLSGEELAAHSEAFPAATRPLSWTDDYCDLWHVIRWRD